MAIDRNQGITGILNPELENVKKAVQETPELGDMYSQFFGGSYQPDIEGGTGTAQYYDFSGKLDPYWAQKTIPVTQEPTAGDAQVAEQIAAQDRDAGITGASVVQPTGGEQINVDTPLTQMITTPTGDTMTVKEAFTQDDAYSLDTPMDIGYGEGQVDPNLAAAVGGKDTPLSGANLVTTSSGDVFAADDPMLQEKMDYTEQDPAFWESARDKFVTTGQDIGGFFGDLKDKGIDVGKMAGSAIMNMIAPGLGFVMQALPPESVANKTTRGVVDELKAENDYGYNMQSGNLNQDPFGRNPVSAFGDYEQTLIDDINDPSDTKMGEAKKEFAQDYFDKKAEFAGGVEQTITKPDGEIVGTGDVLGPGEAPGDLVSLEQLQAEKDAEVAAQNELAKITGDWGALETATGIPDAADTVETIPVEEQELISAQEEEMLAELAAEEEARAEAAAIEQARAQREMQEQIAAAEAMEAARQAEIDRQNREAAAAAATQRARDAAATPSGEGAGGGGGSQQATSGGGFSSGWGGGWGWAKGGRVRYSKGGIVDLL